jgi:hypothetical protein
VLVLNMIEIFPPLGKYKYDTWRILLVKCCIDNSVRLRSCKRVGPYLQVLALLKSFRKKGVAYSNRTRVTKIKYIRATQQQLH